MQRVRKYTAIVKVGEESFVKYRNIGNIERFRTFLNTRFPSWRYTNLYDKVTRTQVGSITRTGAGSMPM